MLKKHNIRKISFLLIFSCIVSIFSFNMNIKAGTESKNDKRACWISFLDMQVYLLDLSEEDFTQKVSEMYDTIIEYGMNTVIVHARAMGDAMYPSEYFPMSIYIDSDRNISYDPMAIMVELAHEKKLYFEAWINPYRLSKNNATTESYKVTEFYEQYKDITIEYEDAAGETCLSLDPAKDGTNQLICNQVKEIIQNYDVDGIHFDDYFYMPNMVEGLDDTTKKSYVNSMVKQVYDTVKSIDSTVTFGISPAGNTTSARSQGADIDTWLSVPGYVDYIMPQIYWSDSYMMEGVLTTLYSDRCNEWMNLNTLDIPIYSGLALYRVGEESETDLGWSQADDNLKKQYEIAYNMGYDGYALFRYEWIEMEMASLELSNLYSYSCNLPDGGVYVEENIDDVDATEEDASTENENTDACETVEETLSYADNVMSDSFMILHLTDDKTDYWNIMSYNAYCKMISYNIYEDIFLQKTLAFP